MTRHGRPRLAVHAAILALLFLVLLSRTLIPAGYMVAPSGGWPVLTLCEAPAPAASGHHDGHPVPAKPGPPCVYAALASPALPPAPPLLAGPAPPPAPGLPESTAPALVSPGPASPPPPSTGPPLLV